MKKETGYYWAFHTNDWEIIFYNEKTQTCICVAAKPKMRD